MKSVCCCCIRCTKSKIYCTRGGYRDHEEETVLLLNPEPAKDYQFPVPVPRQHSVTAQLLRSACDWSVGRKTGGRNWHENSVHQAYIKEILSAEKLIYIENQVPFNGRWSSMVKLYCDEATAMSGVRGLCSSKSFSEPANLFIMLQLRAHLLCRAELGVLAVFHFIDGKLIRRQRW